MSNKKTADAALSLSRASGAVPREDHPTQSLGHNRRSAATSFQVEHRSLGENKLSDQPEEETQYQSARRYSRWPGHYRSSSNRKCRLDGQAPD